MWLPSSDPLVNELYRLGVHKAQRRVALSLGVIPAYAGIQGIWLGL